MKLEISPDERRALRAEAHHLTPVVMIGNDGLTPAVLHEIDVNLAAHGLIKIRVFSDDRAVREEFLSRIAEELDAAPVQHIGKLLIVHRPLQEPEPAEAAPRAKRGPATYLSRSGARRTTQGPGQRAPVPASRQRKAPDAAPRDARAAPRKRPSEDGSHAPGIPGRRRRRS